MGARGKGCMAVEYIWVQSENGATMMARQPAPDPKGLFGEEGFTFKDALDIINPLQQIPIIGSIYRELTGDTIKPGSRLIGGGIYGLGISGVVSAALSNAIEFDTGKDPGALAVALIKGESLADMRTAQAAKTGTQLAQNTYYAGGADPIDPTSLPKGATLIDAPVGGQPPSASQYAALTPPPTALASTTDAGAGTAPLPTGQLPAAPGAIPGAFAGPNASSAPAGTPASVSVSPLPPTINQANATADDNPRMPEMPSSAGLTGLSGRSHLPSAGSITPAAAGLTAAQAKTAMTPTPSGNPMAIASPAAMTAAAATAPAPSAAKAATADAPARSTLTLPSKDTEGYFPLPARVNNVTARAPVPESYANVGRQPGGLSTREGTKPAATATPAPIAIPTAATSPSLASATVAETPAMVPLAQVPDAMMRALDKYDALMRSRRGGAQVDRNL